MLPEKILNLHLLEFWQKIIRQFSGNGPDQAFFWQKCCYLTFWIYLAFFPIGYGWREAFPPLCCVFLLIYYRYGWKDSNLARFRLRWLFICLPVMALLGVLFSINPLASALHAGTALNKGFILPFIAIECVHNSKQLQGLVWALVLACFWQGLDGLWQAYSGHDFIMGYVPNNGRLTGSLGDYTVGNYLALAMIPAWGVWFILKEKFETLICCLLFFALFWPAFFLFQGASSRSGLIALFGALLIWAITTRRKISYKPFIIPCLLVALFMVCQPNRLSLESFIGDNRWDLWSLGWKVFLAHPLTGAGPGEYNEAFKALGLMPLREVHTISHPHNLYLDILYAHGLLGFAIATILFASFLIWGWKKMVPLLLDELKKNNSIYWRLTFGFWLGFMGWLFNGIFGHDFYRTWWLAQAMIALGIGIGATINRIYASNSEDA